ncbi:MAG: MFS transporter [Planctomycetota bacterium]
MTGLSAGPPAPLRSGGARRTDVSRETQVASDDRAAVTVPTSHTGDGRGPTGVTRALRHRNYRLFFGGQGVSLIGTWTQRVALNWLVYRLSGSALLLGVVGFASQIPILLLAAPAGVLADRWDLRRVLMLTQVLALLQAAVLALLTLTGVVTVWHILVLSAFVGLINAIDIPVRQAFVVQMVERPEDLGNAIALNSFLVNGARLIGPSLAGVLIAAIGEGPCFLLNAVSFVGVILALWAMTLAPRRSPSPHVPFAQGLREGFAYAFGFPPIRAMLLLLAVCSLMGMSYTTLLPIFTKELLGGGPHTLGFLLGAAGLGAVIGAVYLAARRTVLGLGKIIAFGAGLFGLSLMAFAASRALWLSLSLMLLAGLGMMLQIASSNTVLQTIVDNDKRGRVMSLYAMAFLGMTPLGSLLAGGLAQVLGAPRTVMLGGGCCVLGALVFAGRLRALRALVRPIYERKGILPEVS